MKWLYSCLTCTLWCILIVMPSHEYEVPRQTLVALMVVHNVRVLPQSHLDVSLQARADVFDAHNGLGTFSSFYHKRSKTLILREEVD